MRSWFWLGLVACDGGKDEPLENGSEDTDSTPDSTAETDASCPVRWVEPPSDHADCTATWSQDQGDDGTVEMTYVEQYDPYGRRVLVTYDNGYRYEYIYGSLTDALLEVNAYQDGDLYQNDTYVYDADGDLVELVSLGQLDRRTTYAPGPCGPTLIQRDDSDDGTIDSEITLTYTPTTQTSEEDASVDGVIDSVTVVTYDAELGRIDQIEGPDFAITYTYDAAGYLASSLSSTTRVEYSYNAEGRLLEVFTDSGDSQQRETASWDCQ